MESQVEKLYENAGVEKIHRVDIGRWDNDLNKRVIHIVDIPDKNIGNYKNSQRTPFIDYYYPPFTAEKQLSLMTFLINRKVGLSFKAEQGEITVEEALAQIVNDLWQDLTEQEKEQIKEILKG